MANRFEKDEVTFYVDVYLDGRLITPSMGVVIEDKYNSTENRAAALLEARIQVEIRNPELFEGSTPKGDLRIELTPSTE